MAVLIEASSVVVLADAILGKFPGCWESFKDCVPNQTLCADNEIARVGLMVPADVEGFIRTLEGFGLVHLRDGQCVDIAVADQIRGLMSPCNWLEYGHISLDGNSKQRIAVCRLVGSEISEVVMPPDWTFDGYLSHSYGFVPSGKLEKSLIFLRHEDGIDVYRNTLTGEEVFIGRASGG